MANRWASFPLFLFVLGFCVCVCVYLCTYVRAYLAIPRVSANDNVKHTKSNIRYDEKTNKIETNVKYIRFYAYEYTERMFASNFSHRDRKPKYLSKF